MGTELVNITVDEIAGDDDEIGVEGVDFIDDEADARLAECRTDMEIAELDDAIALERLTEALQADGDADDLRLAHRCCDPRAADDEGDGGDGEIGGAADEVATCGLHL